MDKNLHDKLDLIKLEIVQKERGIVVDTKKRQAYCFNALAVFCLICMRWRLNYVSCWLAAF